MFIMFENTFPAGFPLSLPPYILLRQVASVLHTCVNTYLSGTSFDLHQNRLAALFPKKFQISIHCFLSFTNHFQSSKWTSLDPRVISHAFCTSNRKAMNRNWCNQKEIPALKTNSVTDVVQTFSWLFGSHDHPLTRQRIFTVNRTEFCSVYI